MRGRGVYAEQELIMRAQQGDRAALHALYQLHAPELLRVTILPIVHERALAQDILADTFVRAMEKLHLFTWRGKGLRPWLARIAKNLCLNHLRRSRRIAAWSSTCEPITELEPHIEHVEHVEQARAQLELCLAQLRPRYREVIGLRLLEQRSRTEVAAQLGLSVATLDVLLCRACKAFRKHWAACDRARANTHFGP